MPAGRVCSATLMAGGNNIATAALATRQQQQHDDDDDMEFNLRVVGARSARLGPAEARQQIGGMRAPLTMADKLQSIDLFVCIK